MEERSGHIRSAKVHPLPSSGSGPVVFTGTKHGSAYTCSTDTLIAAAKSGLSL